MKMLNEVYEKHLFKSKPQGDNIMKVNTIKTTNKIISFKQNQDTTQFKQKVDLSKAVYSTQPSAIKTTVTKLADALKRFFKPANLDSKGFYSDDELSELIMTRIYA